jgi:NADH-quinone oxidoreductase subunit H
MIVISALINAVFLGGLNGISGISGFIIFIIKTLVVCLILTLFKVLMARVRVDQVVKFSWKYLVPISIIQILIDLFIRLRF